MITEAKINSQKLTLILVHGFCENKSMWDDVYPSLNADKVVRWEISGFGDKPLPASNPSLKSWSEEISNYILTEHKDENVVLLGHSMGGYIALELINHHPNLLKGLGLVHSHCFEDPLEKKENRKKVIQFIQKNGTSHWLPQMAQSLLAEHNIENKAFYEKAFSFIQNVEVESVIAGQQAMLEKRDRSLGWSQLDIPLLLVSGEHDTHCTMENVLQMAAIGERLKMVHLSQSGHLGMVEEQQSFIEGVNTYLQWVRASL